MGREIVYSGSKSIANITWDGLLFELPISPEGNSNVKFKRFELEFVGNATVRVIIMKENSVEVNTCYLTDSRLIFKEIFVTVAGAVEKHVHKWRERDFIQNQMRFFKDSRYFSVKLYHDQGGAVTAYFRVVVEVD